MAKNFHNPNIVEERIEIGKIPVILLRSKELNKKIPTILFYHGWGSNKEKQRLRGLILASVGYQVILPDAVNHGERRTIKDYNSKDAAKYFWDTIFTNIEEAPDLIEDLILKYNADPNRIGVMGSSMGGFTAAGILTHNPKVKSAVVFNGSCYWEHSNGLFKEILEIDKIEDQEKIEEKILRLDPMKNLENIINRPLLLLHGDSDTVVPMESQRLFYKKIKPLYEDRKKIGFIHYPYLNHYITTNMMEESIHWMHKHL